MFENLKLRKDFEKKVENQKIETVSVSGANYIEPKLIEINGYKFLISKMPCTMAQEVIVKLPVGLVPLISNFTQAEDMAFKMLSRCERVYDGDKQNVPLISREIIDNHVPDFDTLIKLENECIKYNYDFFRDGKVWTFLDKGLCLAESRLSKILTDLLDKLSPQERQPFTNSKPFTV